MLNQIINGDCLQVMPEIASESIDMIFCDLPYGTTRSEWDVIIPFDHLWQQYERLIKPNGAIVLFAKAPFDKMLWASNPKLYRYDWVWEKNKATGHLNANHMPLQAHEYLLVFYKRPPIYNPQITTGHKPMNAATNNHKSTAYGDGVPWSNDAGSTVRQPRSVLYFPAVNNDDPDRIHVNQKPVPLCEYMVKTYTNEGDTVLDNCSGSASIPLASANTNRNFIAIEKDREIHEKSVNRIENRQLILNI
ncbi:site-specific DNA-methyltransferase [Paenibacillus sp. 1011MAR3C5]|uniref:DNA-methyltransferase n=1 Tax=Paenibacillus sp. 1011MAR3C5 TaxID=1675787 RepID=UPI000E6BFCD7|nr:site-specific DNA-methyltransferase [Paenibacillus sp. 1011MAR3C5]RJE88603.1 site-specific DNA-methyltransferase [Paenibacillus sp. 1011MAR3C5]